MEQSYQSDCRWNSLSLFSTDWHVPHDGDVVIFIVHYGLWLVFVPFVCNLYIMIFTDAPMNDDDDDDDNNKFNYLYRTIYT